MRPHLKLDVWKNAVENVVTIYEKTKAFPPEERYGLTSQIRRCAVSIPANLAEGAARIHGKEFLHFISIAQGSCSELETEILIAYRLGYLSREDYRDLYRAVNKVGRQLVGLAASVQRKS